jgi:hypothetical protein
MRRKKNRVLLPFILFAAVLILTVFGLILSENIRRSQIENPGEYANQDEIPRLTAEEAYQAVAAGEAVLVDTRSQSQYETQRAATAINVPVNEVGERVSLLNPEIWYITYCT